jgi:hypothetical protein
VFTNPSELMQANSLSGWCVGASVGGVGPEEQVTAQLLNRVGELPRIAKRRFSGLKNGFKPWTVRASEDRSSEFGDRAEEVGRSGGASVGGSGRREGAEVGGRRSAPAGVRVD